MLALTIPTIHAVVGTLVKDLFVQLATPSACLELENKVLGYVGHLVGSSVAGEVGTEVTSGLMGEALSWVIDLRKKALDLHAQAVAQEQPIPEAAPSVVKDVVPEVLPCSEQCVSHVSDNVVPLQQPKA